MEFQEQSFQTKNKVSKLLPENFLEEVGNQATIFHHLSPSVRWPNICSKPYSLYPTGSYDG